ncbi:MAG: MFS transporter [Alphaproteobacteria bacterium]|nr:MFS transporter [Alphaproteobacteria bacterium]
MTGPGGRAWLTLGLMSALFFIITATTYASLGLALPAMVAELHWSWTEAGTGFGLLGLFNGITSAVPATLIRRFGARATLLTGSVVMGLAFLALARTDGLILYFAAASLAGLGFTLLDSVPGTYLLSRLFARPSFSIGLFFTVGGLGGVAGPLLYLLVTGHNASAWREYWMIAGGLVVLTGIAAALLVDSKTNIGAEAEADPAISTESWTLRDALQTRQFWIIAAAYAAFLFCGITANTVSVAHLTQHGVAAAVAISMLSVEGLLNSGARLAGGVLTRWVGAKTLLVVALGFLVVGLLALGTARDVPMMLVYAAGIGIGYGLTFFAATILLLDYFGRGPYLELFSTVNLIATTGAVAPTLAGMTRDHTGGFTPFFVVLAVAVSLVLLAVAFMRSPRRSGA